jgi:acyl-coenzyme A synthetase/AMP-(fatty) acid ligase
MPMHFGHGLIGNCLTPLAAGGKLTVWPEPGMAGFAMLGELIDTHEITFMSSVPAMWRIVLRASHPPQKKSLRRVHIGSAPLSVALWESVARWCGTRRIVNTYGTTETANWIGGHSLEDGELADGLVGRPWGGMIWLVRSDG